jgi:hypothetical protein
MKKILLLSALLISALTFAQIPQGISYQAIAMNGSAPVVSSNVGIRLSVLNTSATGTVLYTETHVKMTNAQGLFNLVIGQGTPVTGTMAGINWGNGAKFLKVEMDAAGGTNYILIGTTQLLSVPYAMYAGAVPASALSGLGTTSMKSGSIVIATGTTAKGFYNGTWTTQTFNDYVDANEIIESNGNFVILDGTTVKGFANGVWTTQTFSDYVDADEVIGAGGNFIVLDGTSVKGFANGVWSTQTFPDFVEAANVHGSLGAFVVTSGTTAKGFYNGVWSTQITTDYIDPNEVVEINGSFIVRDGTSAKGFYNGTWSTQTFPDYIDAIDVVGSGKN